MATESTKKYKSSFAGIQMQVVQYTTKGITIKSSQMPSKERFVHLDVWFNEPRQSNEITEIVSKGYGYYPQDNSMTVSKHSTKSIEKLAEHLLKTGISPSIEVIPMTTMKWGFTYLPKEQVTRMEIRDQYRVQFVIDPTKTLEELDQALYQGMYRDQNALGQENPVLYVYKIYDCAPTLVCSIPDKKEAIKPL